MLRRDLFGLVLSSILHRHRARKCIFLSFNTVLYDSNSSANYYLNRSIIINGRHDHHRRDHSTWIIIIIILTLQVVPKKKYNCINTESHSTTFITIKQNYNMYCILLHLPHPPTINCIICLCIFVARCCPRRVQCIVVPQSLLGVHRVCY